MTMRLAGVAFAAVVGACAFGGGGAQAAIVSGTLYGDTSRGGGFNVSFNADTVTHMGNFSAFEQSYNYSNNEYETLTSSSSDAHFNLTNYSIVPAGGSLYYYYANFSFYDPGAEVDFYSTNGDTAVYYGVSYSFGIYADYNSGQFLNPYGSGQLLADAAFVQGGSLEGFPSPVPVPRSLPLFGAALLAIGAAGYVRRAMSADRVA